MALLKSRVDRMWVPGNETGIYEYQRCETALNRNHGTYPDCGSTDTAYNHRP